jgi:hypothetical protein
MEVVRMVEHSLVATTTTYIREMIRFFINPEARFCTRAFLIHARRQSVDTAKRRRSSLRMLLSNRGVNFSTEVDISTDMATSWYKMTYRLLNVPVGLMSSHDRDQAEECIIRLIQQEQVSRAWEMLDRIVEEDRTLKIQADYVSHAMKTDLLNGVVAAWRLCDDETIEPSDVLA